MIKTRVKTSAAVFTMLCLSINLFAQQIGHTTVTFTDASRSNRQIQTEVYYPATLAGDNTPISAGVFPLVVCGHGFVMTWGCVSKHLDGPGAPGICCCISNN